jgi:4-alpha-glucanotransferase
MIPPPPSRRAGILVPLFSIPSSRSWGIGEIGDIPHLARWLAASGQRLLQLLPINEMPPEETSPYSALSAMAIDPQFISMDAVEDFAAAGGEAGLGPDVRRRLEAVRAAPRVEYRAVRELKHSALRRAFACFLGGQWRAGSRRALAFRSFVSEQAWWLDDYTLFRALHARFDERPWSEWPLPFRSREPRALEAARAELADEIQFRQYVQWLAADQWRAARAAAAPVELFGDLPFMVAGDSADVWARQDHFDMDASIGVPPDAFSEEGQDWGLPAYRWDVLAAHDFDWLRDRARRNADLYGGYRVDHLVGFYRTYSRPRAGGPPAFTPADEPAQVALGERVLGVLGDAGSEIIAEDLGVVPGFVRASLARLGIPGYRVLRWEREWEMPGRPFRDPVAYPPTAVATSGTHDTEPLAVWWDQAAQEERDAVLAIPSVRERLQDGRARDAILGALFASGANLLILPIQDVFGWRDRVNQPATVSESNWTWRLPWAVDRMSSAPEAAAVSRQLSAWAREGRRVV